MKTLQVMTGLSLSTLLSITPALAESGAGGTKVYSSGLLVALFIGVCALVVLVQVAPALLTAWGMLKGIGKENEKKLSQVHANSLQ